MTAADAGLLATLRDPATIRARCAAVLRAAESDASEHFRIDRSRLPAVADRVAALTRKRFPDLRIPYHSRWRHFEAGGVDRKPRLDALLAARSAADAARARFDLTVVSVLLDAGAGPDWRWLEPGTGLVLARSEGLGVASWHAFLGGVFSAAAGDALRADAAALARIDAATLAGVFQAGPRNPVVGLEGRAGLLRRLGGVLSSEAARGGGAARPALLFDRITAGGTRSTVAAADVLKPLLDVLAPIWTSGSVIDGQPAGDVWPHRAAGWVPFHKLSQWLAYSLLEPLQWAGVAVRGLDALTGLPEYRNGGLLLDAGVIVPRDAHALGRTYRPGDDFVVEWRALTVALLDAVAALVQQRLGRTAAELPLACVLEGGTWAAGREIAAERRPGGAPPFAIDSDGTVF